MIELYHTNTHEGQLSGRMRKTTGCLNLEGPCCFYHVGRVLVKACNNVECAHLLAFNPNIIAFIQILKILFTIIFLFLSALMT